MAERMMQFAYQQQQCSRVNYEVCRSANQSAPMMREGAVNDMPGFGMGAVQEFHGGSNQPDVADVPPPEKCIGQVVLDWEFIHDLDLHLLKVASTGAKGQGKGGGYSQEPNPEPNPEHPEALADFDLASLVDGASNDLKLGSNQKLETVVFYGSKIKKAADGSSQATLQLDRNAAVHSHQPVENLYLTEKLEPGVYVIGVHNYSQRQLNDNVIGPLDTHTYKSLEEFQKKDPGYQMMEKALKEQIEHANDEDGTPEKIEIMTRVDKEMGEGSRLLQRHCNQGNPQFGVHYGVTIYTYPDGGSNTKHPQAATFEELQSAFKSEFFATAECVFNAEANPSGYNAANILAAVGTEEGKLALSHSKASHVALLKVSRHGDRSKIVEVKMLAASPRAEIAAGNIGGNAMNAFRMQQMRGGGNYQRMTEPFPEPSQLMQMQMQMPMSQMPMQEPQMQLQPEPQPMMEPDL
jgi:hypothetical protein